MAKKKVESNGLLTLPVAFGNVNIGDETARLAVKVSRANLTVGKADANLCCKRLKCKIVARPNGAAAAQESLPGLEGSDLELTGIADTNGFSASGKSISTGLTFLLSTIDVADLSHFAKREGLLIVESVEALPEDGDGEEQE